MGDIKLFSNEITNVSSTMLMTLYCRALESKSDEPILKDPKAEEIVDAINDELKKSSTKLTLLLSINRVIPLIIIKLGW